MTNLYEIAEDCPNKALTDMKTQYVIDQNKQKVEGFIMRNGDQICLSYGGAIRWMTCEELFNVMHDC